MLTRLGRGMTCVHSSKQVLPTDIDGNLSSVVFDLDATQPGSYDGTANPSGGVTITNLASTGSAYNFYGGPNADNSDDPQFVGTAGTASAYFNMDISTRGFMIINGNAAGVGQPDFFRDFHKGTDGKGVTIVHCFRSPAWTGTDSLIMGTQNNVSGHGFKLTYTNASGFDDLRTQVYLTIDDGASGIRIGFPASYIPPQKNIILGLTLEHSGTTTNNSHTAHQ